MFTIKIKREDLSKRSGVTQAANARKAGKHRDKRDRRSGNERRTWKREEWT